MPQARPWFLLLLVALVTSACGGGGGGAAPPPPSLIGEWTVAQLSGESTGPQYAGSYGTWSARPDGSVLSVLTSNRGGSVDPSASMDVANHVLDADGGFEIVIPDPERSLIRGGVSANGAACVGIGQYFGTDPQIIVAARRGAGNDASVLSGSYHYVSSGHALLGVFSSFARATFDGAATVDFHGDPLLNLEGAAFAGQGSAGHPYSVSPEGDLRTSEPQRVGSITTDGEFAFTGGPSDVPSMSTLPFLTAFVRVSTSATLANLRGRYYYVRLRRRIAGQIVAEFGTLAADGVGEYKEFQAVENVDGLVFRIYQQDVPPRPYRVASDGGLFWPSAAGFPERRGAVSPSGHYAILSTAGGQGAGPSITILIRFAADP